MSRLTSILALVLAAAGTPLRAQTRHSPSLAVGQRVRVRIAGQTDAWLLANVSRLGSDTLWLRTETHPVVLPLSQVRRLEVPNGSRSNLGKGLGIGILSGVVLGALAGLASGDDPPCQGWFCWRLSAGDKAEVGAVGLGVLGAVIGGIAGATSRSERWVPVDE